MIGRRIAIMSAIVAVLVPGALGAQGAATQPTPRTADGKPDLTGVYQASTRRGPWDFEAPGDQPGQPVGRATPVNASTRDAIPYQDWAREKAQEYLNRRSVDDPTTFCIPQPSPRITPVGLFPIQFVQTKDTLVILYEYFNVFRSIPIGRALPDDIEPLRSAVTGIVRGELDVALFTTSVQIVHLMQVAETMQQAEAVREGLRRLVVASIGPTCTEELRHQGIAVDLEASHPKMGFLVREAAERSPGLLRLKQLA